ncbi:radical SAM protein [Culturomica massiliensis]|jgi:radical SAM protein with 4Fe4S-binding SPASM domain|uniref:radical SAM protein n=1 Tax=Culturomica massiliensis TaxID=1841857 RepID=UPI000E55A00A|nr:MULTISPECIES: radical SAM protein [Odoribacteraceae]RHV87991.1 radical SAM protein [Odoribacter sp. OF09-27XD]
MDNKKNLVLNAEYKIINDYDRIILIKIPSGDYSVSKVYFIHPIHAKFLSLFDGAVSCEYIIEYLKREHQVKDSDTVRLIKMFDRNDDMYIKFQKEIFFFPNNILVPNDNNIIRDDLSEEKCNCAIPYDFKRLRFSYPKEITYVINLNCYTDCVYCYANRKCQYEPLRTDKILDIIEEAKKIGIWEFNISGGEFFLQKDWEVILKTLIDNGFAPHISTKVPLSEKVIDRAKKIGLDSIQFSLDTLDDEVAQRTLHVKGGYIGKITNSIKYADKAGLDIIVKPTLSKETCTVENVAALLDFAASLKHIKRSVISTIGQSLYIDENTYLKIRPTIAQIKTVLDYIDKEGDKYKFEIHPDSNVIYKEELCNNEHFRNRPRCTANVDGFIILPDGKMTICEELYWHPDFILGDLTRQTILEAWHSDVAKNLWNFERKRIPGYSACRGCEELQECRQGQGVCWKFVIGAYGKEYAFQPDPRCSRAPVPTYNVTGD